MEFVTVQNGQFYLAGKRFRFVGTNAYYMQVMTAFGNPAYTDDVISMATALGMTVLRPFGFRNDSSVAAIQTAPGVYQESGMRALDYVLHKANLAGIKLIIPLANGQNVYGGPSTYAAWAGTSGDQPFYDNTTCKTTYKNLVTHLLNRTNFYNGRVYKEDPTVLAWELANEPHLEGQMSGAITRAWVAEMAAHFKAQDPNHLVSTGEEGYDVTTRGYCSTATTYKHPTTQAPQTWLFNGQKGLRWTENTADPNIDYGSVHIYPEHWNLSRDGGRAWIVDHIRKAKAMGKPLVVGEYGWSADPALATDEWLDAWLREGGDGALFWQLMPTVAYGMHDEFGVQYPPHGAPAEALARFCNWAPCHTPAPPAPPEPPDLSELENRVGTLEAQVVELDDRAVELEGWRGAVAEVSA